MTHRHDPARAIRGLRIDGSHTVLDLGCGDGHHARSLDRHALRKVIFCDIELGPLLDLSRRERSIAGPARRASFVCADALRLPFAGGSFDRVICSLVLYLLPLELALGEIFALMKSGGLAYLRVPMLAAQRARAILRGRGRLRERLYSAFHVWNGLWYAAVGHQIRNPLLRHDGWACYVPRGRFQEAVLRTGFRVAETRIDDSRPGFPSIESWVEKPR